LEATFSDMMGVERGYFSAYAAVKCAEPPSLYITYLG